MRVHEHYTPVELLDQAKRERQAIGQGQGGGIFAMPDRPELGPATWSQMSGIGADSPLVGGRGAPSGGVDPDYHLRRVALGSPAAQPIGQRAHFSELMNLSHNPLGWILLAAIAYLGLVHLHISGRAGAASARVGVGK